MNSTRQTTLTTKSDVIVATFLVTCNLALFLLPVPIASVAVTTNLDPFYYICEQYLLPCPYDRARLEVIVAFSVRLFLTTVTVVEFGRIGGEVLSTYFVPILVLLSILRNLADVPSNFAYSTYIKLVLAFAHAKTIINSSAGGMVFGGQLFTIALAWLVLTCEEILPPFLYYVSGLMTILALLGAIEFMTILSKIPSLSESFLKSKRNEFFTTSRFRPNYVRFRLWEGQRRLLTNCMGFFPLTESIVGVYFGNFIDNLVNAVVLFNPR